MQTNPRTSNQDQIRNSPKRSFFQRDENGQIALFVALIFQIIFVLFALVINVGLLVHHKINLQQSTDLAAYYGAMKQAEILNVIGHMNFQMRQAWKLLTWRYRVVGTFGYMPRTATSQPGLPVLITTSAFSFSPTLANSKCPNAASGEMVSNIDLSPFCIGHNGFGDWGAAASSSENTCSSDCVMVDDGSSGIGNIPPLGVTHNVPGASVAGAISALINTANTTGQGLCRDATVANLSQLANILAAYFVDIDNKTQAMQLMMGSLLVPADQMIDIDGASVKQGVLNTLQNNLTEANFSSLGSKYKFFNSTSTDNGASQGCNSRQQLFNELKFKFVEFVMNVCQPDPATGLMRKNEFKSLYNPGAYTLNSVFAPINAAAPNRIADFAAVEAIVQNEFKLGYEKNPWCQNYFGVRASTEPKIPFLPLARIKLHASSFAKPFGGSIGPWFYNKWPAGSDFSDSNKQVDPTMPPLRIPPGYGSTLAEKIRLLPNFSNYIGDNLGVRDPFYQAIYHDFLLTRSLNRNSQIASKGQTPTQASVTPSKPLNGSYPYFGNWRNISKQVNESEYDPLALDKATIANSHIRDLEISAIAPNQFELAYYSIDPDFFNNYYKDRLDNNGTNRALDKFKTLTPGFNNVIVRPDYGYNQTLSGGNIPIDYSVRHQLAVVENIFKVDGSSSGISQLSVNGLRSSIDIIQKYFTYIPRFQGSLLTSWTYKDLVSQDGFTAFPTVSTGTKMPFGECLGPDVFKSSGTPDYQSLIDLSGAGSSGRLPAAPGNCITGGRTGYSVKIVSPTQINSLQGDIGGLGTGSAPIKNPIPGDFFEAP